ncbi:MAG: MraY family glycosyltransferase [Microbacteriaceae bacterium]
MFYVLTALVAAGTAFVFSLVIWKLALKYELHPPVRERDVHTRPTPRLGGIAMFIGVLVAFAFASQVPWFDLVFADPGPILAILGSALIIVLVGVADDIWDLDWMTKLAAQIIAAGLLAWQGVAIVSLPIGGVAVGSSTMSLIGTILIVVVVMNAVNFIDGLDGLVAGVVIIGNGVFFLYTYVLTRVIGEAEYFNLSALISVILVGACLGFLPLNWHPAKMFMGDAGALLSGLLMAASAISVTGQISVPAVVAERTLLLPAFIPVVLPLAILILPLLDFSLAVLRRLRAGKSPFAADRLHIHHRLLDLGHSHFHAVLLFYAWTTVVSVGCLLFLFVPWQFALTLVGLGIAACTAVTIAPVIANHRRRIAAERAAASLEPAVGPTSPAPPNHVQEHP